MQPHIVTDGTREKPIPEQVRGLQWEYGKDGYLMFNSYGSLDLCSRQRYGVQFRLGLEDARSLGAALVAALSAHDQRPLTAEVKVVNFEVKHSIDFLSQRIRESQQTIAQANALLERLERLQKPPEQP